MSKSVLKPLRFQFSLPICKLSCHAVRSANHMADSLAKLGIDRASPWVVVLFFFLFVFNVPLGIVLLYRGLFSFLVLLVCICFDPLIKFSIVDKKNSFKQDKSWQIRRGWIYDDQICWYLIWSFRAPFGGASVLCRSVSHVASQYGAANDHTVPSKIHSQLAWWPPPQVVLHYGAHERSPTTWIIWYIWLLGLIFSRQISLTLYSIWYILSQAWIEEGLRQVCWQPA